MNIQTNLTNSQKKVIDQLHAQNNVTVVTEAANKRVRVSMCQDPDSLSAFRWSLFVGKRGKIFEEEYGDF